MPASRLFVAFGRLAATFIIYHIRRDSIKIKIFPGRPAAFAG